MNCPTCGQAMPEGTTLCPHCGYDSAMPAQSDSSGTAQGPAAPPAGVFAPNPAMICQRCGHQLPSPAGYCPNCGALMTPSGQWPPPPAGYNPGPLSPRDTGSLVGGFFGGLALSLFGALVALVGPIIAIVFYFVFKKSQPTFARGWGFGILAAFAIALGLFATCMGIIAYSVHH